MTIIKNIYGVLEKWLIGSVLLKNSSGALLIRNENDNDYANIRVADPVDDLDVVNKRSVITVPGIRHHMITDYMTNIRASATTDGNLSEATMKNNGEIVGISAYTQETRTAGTATFYPTINDVMQTATGQTCIINATNTRRVYTNISTPIQYIAGQSVGVRCVTSGFSPNNTKAVVALFLRDR